jgi:hypothetical protein
VPLLVAGWLAFVIALVGGALSIADMRELL